MTALDNLIRYGVARGANHGARQGGRARAGSEVRRQLARHGFRGRRMQFGGMVEHPPANMGHGQGKSESCVSGSGLFGAERFLELSGYISV